MVLFFFGFDLRSSFVFVSWIDLGTEVDENAETILKNLRRENLKRISTRDPMTYVGSRQGRVPQIQNTFTASLFNVHAISLSLNTKVSVLRERAQELPKNENP